MCIRDSFSSEQKGLAQGPEATGVSLLIGRKKNANLALYPPVSYTHLRAHETALDLVCRLLLEKKRKYTKD